MKKLLILLLLFVQTVFAGDITDSANLLNNSQLQQLKTELQSKPVWIETWSGIGDITSYTKRRVQFLANNSQGYLVVVTTNPRKYHISAAQPVGVAALKEVSDNFVFRLKSQQYYEAFSYSAQALSVLPPPASKQVTKTTTTTTQKQVAARTQPSWGRVWIDFGVILGFFVVSGLIIWLIWWILEKRNERERLEEQLENVQEEARSQRRAREIAESRHYSSQPTQSAQQQPTVSNTAKAQTFYNQYTPEQRQNIVNNYSSHPNYYPGIYNDPLQFYLFLTMVNAISHHGLYCGPGYHHYHGGYGGGYADSGYNKSTETITETETATSRQYTEPTATDTGGSWSTNSYEDTSTEYDSGNYGSDSGSSYDSGGSFDGGGSGGDSGGSW